MFLSNALPEQVVVLCPGPGEADPRVPPALVPVNGVPFLRHLLANVKRGGLRDVILVTGPGGAAIERAFGDGAQFGLRLRWLHDPEDRLGSGGALLALEQQLAPSFFVLRGDRYLLVDFEPVAAAYVERGLPCLMTVWPVPDPLRQPNCLVETDEAGRPIVARYATESRKGMRHVEYGLAVMRDDVVSLLPDGYSPLQALHQRNALRRRIAAFEVGRRYFDVASRVGVQELRDALVSGAAPTYTHLL